MRQRFEGYGWMWGAIRRWRGGPVWQRSFLFLALVLRDLVPVSRKVLGFGSVAVVGAITLAVLWPSFSEYQYRHVEIDLFSDGVIQVNGRVALVPELRHILAQYPVRTATVGVEADVNAGAVDQIQHALVENGVRLARFERLEASGSGS